MASEEALYLLQENLLYQQQNVLEKELLLQSVPELMDVVSKKKSPKQALKNTISNTVKKQTGGSLALRMRQKRMNRRRFKRSGSKARKGSKKRKVVISKHKQPKRSRSDFFAKVKDDR